MLSCESNVQPVLLKPLFRFRIRKSQISKWNANGSLTKRQKNRCYCLYCLNRMRDEKERRKRNCSKEYFLRQYAPTKLNPSPGSLAFINTTFPARWLKATTFLNREAHNHRTRCREDNCLPYIYRSLIITHTGEVQSKWRLPSSSWI
jgi:hypothetical protein